MWLCSAIWVNPTRVTTAMVPMHTGTGKGVNTPRTAGTMQILATKLVETCLHMNTPADNKQGTKWLAGNYTQKKTHLYPHS